MYYIYMILSKNPLTAEDKTIQFKEWEKNSSARESCHQGRTICIH